MSTKPDDLRLRLFANWQLRPRTLGEFIDERIGFLKRLQRLHPLFREGLYVLGSSKADSPALSPDLSNLEALLLKRAWNRSAGPSCCDNLGLDGMPTRQSKTNLDFYCVLDNLRPQSKDHVQMRLSGGSTTPEQGGGVGIDLPCDGGSEFADPKFLLRLLRVTIEYWGPEQAGISSDALQAITRVRGRYATPIAWLNYLDDPLVEKALPADIHRSSFGDGLLFSLQPEPPHEVTPALAEKAVRVRDALLPGGWMTPRTWRGKRPLGAPAAA